MKLNLILLPQLLCAIHKVSGCLHLSKTMAGTEEFMNNPKLTMQGLLLT